MKGLTATTRAALLCGVLCLAAAVAWADTWQVFSNATLIPNRYNDGDSFHVRAGRKEYVFRLYFVDTAETDDSVPGRIEEQAKYWDIEPAAALRLAERATAFSQRVLKDKFTVYTKMEDARGRGHLPRHFAMIRVEDEYLSAALVSAGLARIYGVWAELPDGKPGRKYVADLRVLERAARRAGHGAWGGGESFPATDDPGKAPPVTEREVSRSVAVYSDEDEPRLIGFLHRGARVEVVDTESAVWTRVRFDAADNRMIGLCRRLELILEEP